jgi:hypothetical protein
VWEQRACEHSDQYSLAATYVELRLGRMLYPGSDWVQMMLNHREGKPDLEPLPRPEQVVLYRALAKDPNARFPNCLAFYEELAQAVPPAQEYRRLPSTRHRVTPGHGSDRVRTPPVARRASTAEPANVELLPTMRTPQAAGPAASQEASPPSTTPQPGDDSTGAERPGRPWLWVAGALVPLLLLAGGIVFGFGLLVPPTHRDSQRVVSSPPTHGDSHRVVSTPTARTEPSLPAPWVPETDARIEEFSGQRYATRIACVLPDEQHTHIVFRLLRPTNDLPPFYIMETKISNRMFRVYAEARNLKDTAWRSGAIRPDRDTGIDEHLDWPVFRVPLIDAHGFAVWLGGELPTAQQWDWAAGRHLDPNLKGPFEVDEQLGKLALRDTGPQPVGTVRRDHCPFSGCKDLASNGLEWTSSLCGPPGADNLPDESKSVSFPPPDTATISLRGASYRAERPMSFLGLLNGVETSNPVQDPGYAPYTSFRVVLPVPPGPQAGHP